MVDKIRRASRSPAQVIEGALVLITRAGSGIGRATALAFARDEAKVLAVDIDAGGAEVTAKEGRDLGAEAQGAACDVADASAMTALAATLTDEHGPPDVLFNNAGVGMTGRFADMSAKTGAGSARSTSTVSSIGVTPSGPPCWRGAGHVVDLASGAVTARRWWPTPSSTRCAGTAVWWRWAGNPASAGTRTDSPQRLQQAIARR
ncbi:MAG: SDR family NAD(P)-dependent oxidoreductase [Acidimicrobiales bacterium]